MMASPLLEWTETYLKHKDLTLKRIISIERDEKSSILDVRFKDKQARHYVLPQLSERILSLPPGNKVIVCLNTEENFSFLIKNWAKISKIKDFSMIFVNIDHNDKWLINPYIHSMIADPESMESGLRTMFETANGNITEVKIGKKKPKIFDDDVADEDDSKE